MEMTLRIQTFEQILSRQLRWIRATDVRGRYVATMSTVLLTSLAAVVSTSAGTLPFWHWLLVLAAAGSTVFALAYVWMAAYPLTTGPDHSIIFFGGIDKHNAEDYVRAAETVSQDDYLIDLAQQCHRNGEIATLKFKLIKTAMKALFLAVPLWVFAALAVLGVSGS